MNDVRRERLLNYTSYEWPGSEKLSGKNPNILIITSTIPACCSCFFVTQRDTAFFFKL